MRPPPGPALRRDERGSAGMWVGLFLATILVALLILAGQLQGRKAEPPRSAPTTPTPSPSETGEAALVSRLERETEEVRGLSFRHPVTSTFQSPDRFERTIRDMAGESDVGQGLPDERVLKALGLIPENLDLAATLEEASAADVVGFYDPDTERLVVKRRGDTLSPLAQVTLVHELTHAVTDQHFDLSSVLSGDEPDDEALARTALVEGDATLSMQRWVQEKLSFGDQLALGLEAAGDLFTATGSDTPPAVEQLLIFPYLQGLSFVQTLYERGGWDAVNRAYEYPPTTTEQIQHPEKYLEGEVGVGVEPAFHRRGYHPIDRGQIGEELLAVMLDHAEGSGSLLGGLGGTAEPAGATGWNGGGYVALEGPRGVIISFTIRWDTAHDGEEFEGALPAAILGRAVPSPTGGNGRYATADGGCVQVDGGAALATSVTMTPFACPTS